MSALAALALKSGLPLLGQILSRKLGPATGELATAVIGALVARTGQTPDTLEEYAEAEPGQVIAAMREVERAAPEMVAVYLRETEGRIALLQAEQEEGGWTSAWRPAGMWLLLGLWLWNIVLLHVANAALKIALPPVPFGDLFQFSALYMGLYMGGHTVKDLAAKWQGKS